MEQQRSLPSKQTIGAAYQAKATKQTYATYQRQFLLYLKDGMDPATASSTDCTDFFHYLYSQGKSARTIDLAKTSLVSYFMYDNYLRNVQKLGHNIPSCAFVFPSICTTKTGSLVISWCKKIDSLVLRNQLKEIVQSQTNDFAGLIFRKRIRKR